MDAHLFVEIIITEGANRLPPPLIQNNYTVEYFSGRSNKGRVPLFIDSDDPEIDCVTGCNILVLLGMEDIVGALFPTIEENLEDEPVKSLDNTCKSCSGTGHLDINAEQPEPCVACDGTGTL